LNITPEEPKKGLRYAAVDVPSGVRGRMALMGPLIEEAEDCHNRKRSGVAHRMCRLLQDQ